MNMKKYRGFSIGLLCAIATNVSAQVSTLPDGFESNIPQPARTEAVVPTYTGIVDARPDQLTSEEKCCRFKGEAFYRIGACSELRIVDDQLRLVPLSGSKYVFCGTIVVPGKIRNGYFGTDSLLLNAMDPSDAEKIRNVLSDYAAVDFKTLERERTDLDSKLKVLEKDQAELKRLIKLRDSLQYRVRKANRKYTYEEWQADGFIGLPNHRNVQQIPVGKFEWMMNRSTFQQGAVSVLKSALRKAEIAIESRIVHVDEDELRDRSVRLATKEKEVEPYRESYDFVNRYYAGEDFSAYMKRKTHPYGNRFVALQDSVGGVHYVQVSLIKDQFVAAKYYDRIRNNLAGKNVCFLHGGASVTDAYSGERIPIESSVLDADPSESRKHLYLCKDIVVHGEHPALCAIIEKGETRFLASIERHLYGIDEENFIYKHGVKLQDGENLLPESVFDAEEQQLVRAKQAKKQSLENAQKAAVVAEKAAAEERKAELIRRFGAEAGTKIAQGRVALGMNKAMCLEAWGAPFRRQQTKNLVGTSEVWYYSRGSRRLMFINDKLVEIVE